MKHFTFRYIRFFVKTLIWLSITAFIVSCMYVFYHSETHFLGFNYTNPFYKYVEYMPVWIYLVLYFIVFSLICAFVFISLSQYYNVQRSNEISYKNKYYKFFTYILTSYFILDFYQNEKNKTNLFHKIKPFVKKRKQILALFEAYLKIQETVSQDLSDDFRLLIKKLDIENDLDTIIFNNSFDDKILAMRMLSYLQIHSNDDQIMLYAKSKNVALRTEAYVALIRLMQTDEHLMDFIGETYQLSMLDINVIVNAILENPEVNINYNQLLLSANQEKIIIGLILIKNSYQKDKANLELIQSHIDSHNDLINTLAWDALLTLVPDDDCINLIINRFDNEKEDVKLNILEKSHHIISKRLFTFLVSIIEHQPLIVKIESMKTIFNNDFDLLEGFVNSQDDEIRRAYDEATCMYIN